MPCGNLDDFEFNRFQGLPLALKHFLQMGAQTTHSFALSRSIPVANFGWQIGARNMWHVLAGKMSWRPERLPFIGWEMDLKLLRLQINRPDTALNLPLGLWLREYWIE
jgi:hypothetical protein